MDERREAMRLATVRWIAYVRMEYLRAGASPLKHWEQIQSRMLAATRSASTVGEWATRMMRGLQLPPPSNSGSLALDDLVTVVGKDCGAWLDMIEQEYGLVMAEARLDAEARKEKRR